MQPKNLALGFIAAFLAVLFFHQATIGFYHGMGWIPNPPFRQTPLAPWGVPALWSACFWGGMWGILFAIIQPRRPAGIPFWLFTVLFCILVPLAVGAWVIVPWIKGTPFFQGFNAIAMARGVGIYAVWGIGLALLWRGLPSLFCKGGEARG